jgi:hypothetical protein
VYVAQGAAVFSQNHRYVLIRYGPRKPFRIWVAVLDDSDVPKQVELSIARSQGKYDAMSGAEGPGLAKDFVDTVLKSR